MFAFGLELFTLKRNRFSAQLVSGLLLAVATLSLAACGNIIYREPEFQYAGRTVPPSGLLQRVLVTYTSNGTNGGAVMLDGLRDTRTNVQDTIMSFPVGGFSSGEPTTIINYPEQQMGYILGYTDGSLSAINYATEKGAGSVANFGSYSPSAAAAYDGSHFYGAVNGVGVLEVVAGGATYSLNLPNVDKVVVNPGDSVVLAMVRNSNALYRVLKLPQTASPVYPKGAIDCQPVTLPVFCVVPVPGTFDHPGNAFFSLDGNSAYILNCGPECGGTTAGVTFLAVSALNINNPCTTGIADPNFAACASTPPPAMESLSVSNPIPIPGGVTVAQSDANNLYLAGQQLQPSSGSTPSLFAGELTVLPFSTLVPSAPIPISDGVHTRMLFADNNTLWIGSQQCASGVRAYQASLGVKTQAANYNCLTRFSLGTTPGSLCATTLAGGGTTNPVFPSWVPNNAYTAGQEVCSNNQAYIVQVGGTSAASTPQWNATLDGVTQDGVVVWINLGAVSPVQIVPSITPNSTAFNVEFPNTDQNPVYYDNLTGLCWVQLYGKVYTAYGGQIHAFNTSDGSERDNTYITIQGTALDVAYMDALTNNAD